MFVQLRIFSEGAPLRGPALWRALPHTTPILVRSFGAHFFPITPKNIRVNSTPLCNHFELWISSYYTFEGTFYVMNNFTPDFGVRTALRTMQTF